MTSVHRVRFTVELAYSQLYEFFRLLESWGGRGEAVSGSFRSILRFFRHDARLESVACNCKLKLTVEKRWHENAEEKGKKGNLTRLESAERNYPRRA